MVLFQVKFNLFVVLLISGSSAKEECTLRGEDVKVNWEDFKCALQKFVPSINAKDMEYFNKLKVSFSS